MVPSPLESGKRTENAAVCRREPCLRHASLFRIQDPLFIANARSQSNQLSFTQIHSLSLGSDREGERAADGWATAIHISRRSATAGNDGQEVKEKGQQAGQR